MTVKQGPCEECGVVLRKYVRPGRKLLHLECAVVRMERRQREMADRSSAAYTKNWQLGQLYRQQYAIEGGEWYENYRKGMLNYLKTAFPTTDTEPGTVPADQPGG